MKRLWIALLVIVGVAAVGGAGYWGSRSVQAETTPVAQTPPVAVVTRGDVAQSVTAPGVLMGTRKVTLAADVGGRVAALDVRPGDRVKAGEVLARLATGDLDQAVASAELDLRWAQLELEKLQRPVDEADIRAAEHAVSQAGAALGISQSERDQTLAEDLFLNGLPNARISYNDKKEWYESRQRLFGEGKLDSFWFVDQARREFEDAQKNLQVLEAQAALKERTANSTVSKNAQAYQEAKDKLAALQAGQDPLELEAAQIKVQEAQMALDSALVDLTAAVIKAPFAGVVLEVKAAAGEAVAAGGDLIVLSDPNAVEIAANVIEEDYPLVAVGQPAELFFDAQPELAIPGRVARIVPLRSSDDRPLYPVIIAPDAALPETLAPGMTVDASVVLDLRTAVLRLPRAVVRARSDGSAQVKVWDGQAVVERAVKVGLRGDTFVEILEGLQEGEQVVAE